MKHSSLSRWLTLMAVMSWATFSVGQSDTGRIAGTVTDPSGAVVPGATVSITNIGKDRTVTVQSGGAGEYSATTLSPGDYKVEVKAANFKSETQQVTLQVNQTLPLNFTHSPGAASENVEVSGAAP